MVKELKGMAFSPHIKGRAGLLVVDTASIERPIDVQ